MGWHAEAPDADLNWPAGHSAQEPSLDVDPRRDPDTSTAEQLASYSAAPVVILRLSRHPLKLLLLTPFTPTCKGWMARLRPFHVS